MHCGWHSCCWENRAHFFPTYAQPPMWEPRYRRRMTKAEEKDLIRERLEELRAEMDDLAQRLAAVEE
jgi:hypothetical protein